MLNFTVVKVNRIKMINRVYKLVVVCILLVSLFGCTQKQFSEQYIQQLPLIIDASRSMSRVCNFALDAQRDWLIARIYFDVNTVTLKATDKNIINSIDAIYQKCGKPIVLIAHASVNEQSDVVLATELADKRAQNVYNALLALSPKISTYLHVVSCANTDPLVVPSSEQDLQMTQKQYNQAMLFNQRLDVVMVNTDLTDYALVCLF